MSGSLVTAPPPTTSGPHTVAELKKVTDDQLKRLASITLGWTFSEQNFEKAESLKHQGFDYKLMWSHIILCIEEQLKKGKDPKVIQEEMFELMLVGLIVNKVSQKKLDNMADEGAAMISKLESNWRVSRSIQANRRTAFTFLRHTLCFPGQAVITAMQICDGVAGPFNSAKLPPCFFTGAFASTIPVGFDVTKALIIAATAYACDVTCAVKGLGLTTMKPEEKTAVYVAQVNFTNSGFLSTVLDNKHRCSAQVFLKMENYYDPIMEVVKGLGTDGVVDKAVWITEFAKIAATSVGAADITIMPSIRSIVTQSYDGPLLTENVPADVTLLRVGTTTPRNASVTASYETLLAREFGSSTPIASETSIPYVPYALGEDCSDLVDYKHFLDRTKNYHLGAKVWDVPTFKMSLSTDQAALDSCLTSAFNDALYLDITMFLLADGTSMQASDVRDKARLGTLNVPFSATDSSGRDALYILADAYIGTINSNAREDQIELNRALLYTSSHARRQLVYATL